MALSLKKEFDGCLSEDFKTAINSAAAVAENYGIKIYLIGGVVRDLIMHSSVKDIDIAVEGNAVDFCRLLEQNLCCKISALQENLLTAKVLFDNNIEIDFASTREEKYLKSGNLPEAYNFGCSLEKDVKRRDFTINTLAITLTGDDKFLLIDYYNGYSDIQNKLVRILHEKSFIDDPSRIIRALKFKLRFNFEFEDKTYTLMQQYLSKPDKSIPMERIKNELYQYFSIPKKSIYNSLLKYGIYKLISDKPYNQFDENRLDEIQKYNIIDNISFFYTSLLIINDEEIFINLTAKEMKIIKEIKDLLNSKCNNNKFEIYKKYADKEKLALAVYYIMTNDKTLILFLEKLRYTKILINGKDLINIGLNPSPKFSKIFDEVLKEKLENHIKTKEEEINFVKQLIKKGE